MRSVPSALGQSGRLGRCSRMETGKDRKEPGMGSGKEMARGRKDCMGNMVGTPWSVLVEQMNDETPLGKKGHLGLHAMSIAAALSQSGFGYRLSEN